MEKISVIIPVYNAGEFLKTCLDSVINQTYRNLEIILINDGSNDGSAKVCYQYSQSDNRIKLIHKKLGGSGVGASRNTGLSHVTGEYIVFVDNDDWLELDHIEKLYNALKQTDSDVAVANFTQFFEKGAIYKFHITKDSYFQKEYTPQEWFAIQYEGRYAMSQCFTVPWCKLYKASLFENIVYPENEKVEDDLTTWKVYLMANKIVYTNEAIYYHRKRENSITGSVDIASVFPLKSIEERVVILSLLGFNIENELKAYRWRLNKHKDYFLEKGLMQEYQKCLQKLMILEKWHK